MYIGLNSLCMLDVCVDLRSFYIPVHTCYSHLFCSQGIDVRAVAANFSHMLFTPVFFTGLCRVCVCVGVGGVVLSRCVWVTC